MLSCVKHVVPDLFINVFKKVLKNVLKYTLAQASRQESSGHIPQRAKRAQV